MSNTPNKEAIMGMAGAAMLERKRKSSAGGDGNDPKRGHPMRVIFSSFPLLLFPVLIYNLMAFVFGGGGTPVALEDGGSTLSTMIDNLNDPLFSLPMISDVSWSVSAGDALLLFAVAMLFLEIIKATSTGTSTIFNHALSMIIFIVCLVEFLLFQQFATSVFFILTMMTLLDVLAGVMVTIVSARRDFGVGEGFGG